MFVVVRFSCHYAAFTTTTFHLDLRDRRRFLTVENERGTKVNKDSRSSPYEGKQLETKNKQRSFKRVFILGLLKYNKYQCRLICMKFEL